MRSRMAMVLAFGDDSVSNQASDIQQGAYSYEKAPCEGIVQAFSVLRFKGFLFYSTTKSDRVKPRMRHACIIRIVQ